MPFKSERISYGLARGAYPQEAVANCEGELARVLGLTRPLVGVKLLFQQEAYDAYDAPEPTAAMSYCLMVKAATQGRALKSRLQHHNCDGGTTALGLEKSTERIESGEEYYSYRLYASPVAARRHRASIRSLHAYQPVTYGVVTSPLSLCTEAPDVVLAVVSPYQAMRLVQGWEYETGMKPQTDIGAMQGFCSELTATPYLTGQMNVSVLCPSTRMLCRWGEQDMAVGIPFEQLERVIEGVVATQLEY